MFRFFKKTPKLNDDLFLKICKSLPNKYTFLSHQVQDGILYSVKKQEDNYYKFNLNNDLFEKYEDKTGRYFQIKGIILSYKDKNIPLILRVGYGLLLGYSTPDNSLLNSLESNDFYIDISQLQVEFFDDITPKIITLFSKKELNHLSLNDIYEIELKGNSYYHLKDMTDGDFIAIDRDKNIYVITHDPFEIKKSPDDLLDILTK